MSENYNYKPFPHSSHSKIIRLAGTDKKVLDIGCASGYIASRLKERGCSVVGVDNDKKYLNEAKKHCDKVYLKDISKDKIEGKYDVIILGDVIEHLTNPEEVLMKLRKNLNEKGYIIVSVPNIANISVRLNLLLGKFDYTDKGIMDRTHFRFFTEKTFRETMKKSGYKITHLETTPIPIFLAFPNLPKPILRQLYSVLNMLSEVFPTLFGYQFVAKIE